jgi:hypothetical protein
MRSRSAGLMAVCVALFGCAALAAGDLIVKDHRGRSYNITLLRKQLAYRSMTERLDYETKHADRRTAAPKESKALWQHLEEFEGQFLGSTRAESLRALHAKEVVNFIRQDGNGIGRMLDPPSPRYWLLTAAAPIAIKKQQGKEDEQASAGVVLPPKDEEGYRGMRWPTVPSLLTFHDGSLSNFANPIGFGHIKDREHVSGFMAHHFRSMPEWEPEALPVGKKQPAAKERWRVSRLELVSLLKHDKPAVYLSDNLPRMQDLKKVKTRPLSDFEDSALQSLGKGEDLVAEASTNRIVMVGSIRAVNECLKCHDVKRGDLLGSFSYELRRDPPLGARK